MKPKLILAFEPAPGAKLAAEKDFQVIQEGVQNMPVPKILELAEKHQVDALMVTLSHKFTTKETIGKLPKSVKIIATTSVGFDNLNVAELKARGIYATNTPDVLTDATADLTLLLMLGASRRVRDSIQVVSSGWGKILGQAEMLGLDLSGKTLGILGMGRIGQAVAKRAKAFGMKVYYSNRKRLPADLENGATFFENFHDMIPHCQVLSLHAPGTEQTEKIMSVKEFSLMPTNSIFINVARGTLVDEDAFFEAVASKHLFAAGLDVCRDEPTPDPRFFKYQNILLTPHVGSATEETRAAMGLRSLANIKSVMQGQRPVDELT